MRKVSTDRAGECPLLSTAMLMSLIEERFNLRIAGKHSLVEPPRDGFRVGGHCGRYFLDDVDCFLAEHSLFLFECGCKSGEMRVI